jgi:hypothetical protein
MLTLSLCGAPVTSLDLTRLVRMLLSDGSPDALDAADTITTDIRAGRYAYDLGQRQRDAVLKVLDPPPVGLCEVSGLLAQDLYSRRSPRPRARSSSGAP